MATKVNNRAVEDTVAVTTFLRTEPRHTPPPTTIIIIIIIKGEEEAIKEIITTHLVLIWELEVQDNKAREDTAAWGEEVAWVDIAPQKHRKAVVAAAV